MYIFSRLIWNMFIVWWFLYYIVIFYNLFDIVIDGVFIIESGWFFIILIYLCNENISFYKIVMIIS